MMMMKVVTLATALVFSTSAFAQDASTGQEAEELSKLVEGIEDFLRFDDVNYLSNYRVDGVHFSSDTTATIYFRAVDPRDGDDLSLILNAVHMADRERWVIVRAAERGGGINATRWPQLWYVLE